MAFPYLSEGCAPLLGVSGPKLQQDPARFLRLILPEDRKGYLEAMAVSGALAALELGRPDLDRGLERRQVDQPARHAACRRRWRGRCSGTAS
jgi:hypothetical protein